MKLIFSLILVIFTLFVSANANVDSQIDRLAEFGESMNITLSQSVCNAAAAKAEHYATCGCPYVWGGTSCGCGGSGGMDCSGIVYTSFREAGWTGITRTTTTQYKQGTSCSGCSGSNTSGCKAGDLLFYCFGCSGGVPDHVIMAIGGNRAVQCPEPGQDCSVIDIYSENYMLCRSMC
ncbi:hypothetical protein ACTFIZ_012385 [Dictyostelium cf. discoideum]